MLHTVPVTISNSIYDWLFQICSGLVFSSIRFLSLPDPKNAYFTSSNSQSASSFFPNKFSIFNPLHRHPRGLEKLTFHTDIAAYWYYIINFDVLNFGLAPRQERRQY